MKDAKAVKAIAVFDNRDFDESWNRGVSRALKDSRSASKPTSPEYWDRSSTGIRLCQHPKR
jgi:hypothetical protein